MKKFLNFLNKKFIISVILVVSLFLRVYRLDTLMAFIPDQGWFYLSARDMILTGQIPLVGPPTSHPWIHHGPLWTYTLGILFFLLKFDPVAPAYYIAILGTVTVWLINYTFSRMFSKTVGLIAALLFATSPLIVMNARIPYHTSPIPFFVIILFYLSYLWVKGNAKIFPLIMLLLAILYNHEITTFVFDIIIGIILAFGLISRKKWAIRIFSKKIFFSSMVLFIIPMIPFLIYDTSHGYRQTFGFGVWILYRLVRFPLNLINPVSPSSPSIFSSLPEFFSYFKQLIFQPSLLISFIIFICLCFYLIFLLRKEVILTGKQKKQKSKNKIFTFKLGSKSFIIQNELSISVTLLLLFLLVSIPGLFLHRVPIEADTLLVSPFIFLLISLLFDRLLLVKKLKAIIVTVIIVIAVSNSYFLLSTSYFTNFGISSRISISQQLKAVDKVISIAGTHRYNIVGKGELSSFPVFLMPYKYLLWWRGHSVSDEKQNVQIQIWEKGNEILVQQKK